MASSLVILSILFTLIKAAQCINCYQCSGTDSSNPFLCNEFLESDSELVPVDCANIHGAQYCIKTVGRFEGGISTKRHCSSLDLGNYCNYVQQPGDKLEYRTCIYTCNSDGCNGSSIKTLTTGLLMGVIILTLVMRM